MMRDDKVSQHQGSRLHVRGGVGVGAEGSGTGNTGIYVIPDAALIGLLLYYHLTLKADMTAAKLHLSTPRLADSGHPFLHAAAQPCCSSITADCQRPRRGKRDGPLRLAESGVGLRRTSWKLIQLIPAVFWGFFLLFCGVCSTWCDSS